MEKFSVVCRDDDASKTAAVSIIKKLKECGKKFELKNPELVIVIGGDGTFLSAIQQYISIINDVYFVGIHSGTLGFFSDYTINTYEKCLSDVISKKPVIESKHLLKTEVNKKQYFSVNEARIESVMTQSIDVLVDDTKIETFRGNGLCISTQMGSTGYNRSVNGAIVENGLEVLQLTEIAGVHHTVYRSANVPIILSPKRIIKLQSQFNDINLCFDRYSVKINKADEITVSLSDRKVNIAHYYDNKWFNKIEQLF